MSEEEGKVEEVEEERMKARRRKGYVGVQENLLWISNDLWLKENLRAPNFMLLILVKGKEVRRW